MGTDPGEKREPAEKVVALPVKDPYHVMRNLILIIECIYSQMKS